MEHCCARFRKQTGADMQGDARAMRRLRSQCEKVKRTLSSAMNATIEIDCLHQGEDFYLTISRSQFEELCSDLFLKCMTAVN